ncbi:MAG TPA: leucyl/phenylalanyl-tRNA--protein transferase [Flavobacteriaceae bacterium]|nr:leucyl/phenylalanyl-tRNA--protein transferase [Flavobacteriaceae bacterium]
MFFYFTGNPFPDPALADKDGLLAAGGDLSVETLLKAYYNGIFPWFNPEDPVLWWSPNPRMVLFLDKFKVSKSLRKSLREGGFSVTFNQCFEEVIKQCSAVSRKGQKGTWITEEMLASYVKLHRQGYAVSVECWKNQQLVGGLYGVDLKDKKIFGGESMFHTETDASKVALYFLVEKLRKENYKLIDCQVYTKHLASLGAEEIPREEFLKFLK